MPQKKNKGRVNLYIDGEFCCGLDLFTAQKYRLKIDAEIEKAKLTQVVHDAECSSAFEKAMHLVNIRLRSEKEIRDYLQKKEYSAAIIEDSVEKLKSYRYINDAEFARMYIEAHRAKWGNLKIKFALKAAGVDAEIVAAAFEDIPDQTEEAYVLAVKYNRNKTEADRRKLFAHLMQKGFDTDTIRHALIKLKEETENSEV